MASMVMIMAVCNCYGFAYGILFAFIYPNDLLAAILLSGGIALLTGILLGGFMGQSGQIEGMFAGLMAALMGAMLVFMLPGESLFLVLSLTALTSATLFFIRTLLNRGTSELTNVQEFIFYCLMCFSIIFIFATFPFTKQPENHIMEHHQLENPTSKVGFLLYKLNQLL